MPRSLPEHGRTMVLLDKEAREIFDAESNRLGLSLSAYLRTLARKIRDAANAGGRML